MRVAHTGPDAAEEGELFPDVDTPWLPAVSDPAIALPAGAVAAGTGALAAWTNSGDGTVMALLTGLVAAALVVLSVIDVLTMRLPNAIVLPLYPAALAGATAAALLGEITWVDVLTGAACMAGIWVIMYAVAVLAGGLGYGDVKLAGLLGLILGLQGPFTAALGTMMLPMAIGGLVAFALVLAGRRGPIAFGPFLAGGALLVMLLPDAFVGLFLGGAG